jgi:hypothetical protein
MKTRKILQAEHSMLLNPPKYPYITERTQNSFDRQRNVKMYALFPHSRTHTFKSRQKA